MTKIKLVLLSLFISSVCFAQTSTKGIQYVNRASIPCDANTSCMWVDNTNEQVQFYDGTTAKTIPTIVTSTKGDIAVFNGTIWEKVGAGSNGECLTAQNATSSGVDWADCDAATTLQSAYDGGRTITMTNTTSPIEMSAASTGQYIAYKDDSNNTLAIAKNWGISGGGTKAKFGLFDAAGVNGIWFDDVQTEVWASNSLIGMYADHTEMSVFSTDNILYMDANESSLYGPSGNSGFKANATTAIIRAGNAERVTFSSTAMTATISGIFQAPSAGAGSVLKAQTNGGATDLFNITDNSSQTIRSAMADGASAVGLIVDTTTAWANTGAKLQSWRTNGVEKAYLGQPALADFWELRSTNTFLGLRNSGGSGYTVQGTSMYIYVSGSAFYEWTSSLFRPTNDQANDLGNTSSRWKAIWQGKNSIGTAQTVGITMDNQTAATVGTPQYSPALTLLGKTWETTGGTSQTAGWLIQAQGVNATTASSYLTFYHNRNTTLDAAFRLEYSTGGATIFRNPVGTSLWYSTNGNAQIQLANGLIWIGVGSSYFDIAAGYMRPEIDINTTFGDSTHRLLSIWQGTASVGTAATVGISANNTTAAAAGAQQYSPMLVLEGQGWKTDATAESQLVGWALQTRPVQDAAAPKGILDFKQKIGSGSYTTIASLDYANTTYPHFMIPGTSGGYFFSTSNLDGIAYVSGSVLIRTNAAAYWTFNSDTFISSDGAGQVGTVAARLLGVRAYSYDTKMGAQLTAAATITPTAGFHHVTGATTIDTIAVTNLAGNPTLVLVADGGTITVSAAGNVLTAVNIAQNTAQWFIYDLAATKWVPQQ